jgi:hypothetical protein
MCSDVSVRRRDPFCVAHPRFPRNGSCRSSRGTDLGVLVPHYTRCLCGSALRSELINRMLGYELDGQSLEMQRLFGGNPPTSGLIIDTPDFRDRTVGRKIRNGVQRPKRPDTHESGLVVTRLWATPPAGTVVAVHPADGLCEGTDPWVVNRGLLRRSLSRLSRTRKSLTSALNVRTPNPKWRTD